MTPIEAKVETTVTPIETAAAPADPDNKFAPNPALAPTVPTGPVVAPDESPVVAAAERPAKLAKKGSRDKSTRAAQRTRAPKRETKVAMIEPVKKVKLGGKGQLAISSVSGGTIWVDGRSTTTARMTLEPGKHNVTMFDKKTKKAKTFQVEIKPNQTTTVRRYRPDSAFAATRFFTNRCVIGSRTVRSLDASDFVTSACARSARAGDRSPFDQFVRPIEVGSSSVSSVTQASDGVSTARTLHRVRTMMPDEPTVLVASRNANEIFDRHRGQRVVRTPLELVVALVESTSIATVVLVDIFARERAVEAFLRESFPWVHVITIDWPTPDSYRAGRVAPAYASL